MVQLPVFERYIQPPSSQQKMEAVGSSKYPNITTSIQMPQPQITYQIFIFIKDCFWTQLWARSSRQCLQNIFTFFHPLSSLQIGFCLWGLLTNTLYYAFIIPPLYCPAQLFLLEFITQAILWEEFTLVQKETNSVTDTLNSLSNEQMIHSNLFHVRIFTIQYMKSSLAYVFMPWVCRMCRCMGAFCFAI